MGLGLCREDLTKEHLSYVTIAIGLHRPCELTKCIRTNLDCADLCEATGRILSRHTGYDANLTRAALEACRRCENACAELLNTL